MAASECGFFSIEAALLLLENVMTASMGEAVSGRESAAIQSLLPLGLITSVRSEIGWLYTLSLLWQRG